MPLIQAKSEKSLKANVKRLIMEGKTVNQAVAMARDIQREERRKDAHKTR